MIRHRREPDIGIQSYLMASMAGDHGTAARLRHVADQEAIPTDLFGVLAKPLKKGDQIVCRSSAYSLMLVRPPKMMFFDVLRQKLKWGER